MKRGEVRWHTFKQPDKRRPVIVLTRDPAISFLHTVTVVPITSTVRHVPSEVFLSQADGLIKDCAANFYNIQTIPKTKIGGLIAVLSPAKMREVEKALCFTLGVDR